MFAGLTSENLGGILVSISKARSDKEIEERYGPEH
jgi:hypothetical protein